MADESRFFRQLLPEQAWWAERQHYVVVFIENDLKSTLSTAVVYVTITTFFPPHLSIYHVKWKNFNPFCLAGFSHRRFGGFSSTLFHRQYHSPLKEVCSDLQFLPGNKLTLHTWSVVHLSVNEQLEVQVFCVCLSLVWVQSRGFKTLRSKTRRAESGYDDPVESEPYTPAFMKVGLTGTISECARDCGG